MTRRIKWTATSYGFLLILLASGVGAVTEPASGLYNEGNALYRKGDYEAALTQYQAALATGLRNSDLYFNLGNAQFKMGALGQALLNYERALRLSPGDHDVRENIAFANATRVDRFGLEPANAATRYMLAFYRWFSPNDLSVWVSLTFLLACAGVGGLLLLGERRTQWIVLIAFCLLACGLGSALLATKISDMNRPMAIVLKAETVGRSGPGEDFLQVFSLHEGAKVSIERKEGLWVLVRLPNGIGGWIVLDGIGKI